MFGACGDLVRSNGHLDVEVAQVRDPDVGRERCGDGADAFDSHAASGPVVAFALVNLHQPGDRGFTAERADGGVRQEIPAPPACGVGGVDAGEARR